MENLFARSDDLPPVRNWDGTQHDRVIVIPGEVTCQSCGEVYHPSAYTNCPRCNNDRAKGAKMIHTPTTPTIDYLRPGEYVIGTRS